MKVLIITGTPGVGKSTISKLWAVKNEGVTIECDYFTEWIYNSKFEKFGIKESKLVVELTLATAEKYLKSKMPVVIENVWKANEIKSLKTAFEKMKVKLKMDLELSFVYLYCSINENHRRDELRKPEDQMKKRVDIVNNELKIEKFPKFVKKIDSSKLNETETLQRIGETFG